MAKLRSASFLLALFCSAASYGYELQTHDRLTELAFDQSLLPKRLAEFGLDISARSPIGQSYYDMAGTSVRERAADNFEIFKMTDPDSHLSIKGWLARGAIREDDITSFDCWFYNTVYADEHSRIEDCNPQNDPDGNITRVRNHFYDPIYDRGLTGVLSGQSAIEWALGTRAPFASPVPADPSRRNHFTVFDAREAMYRALTGPDSTVKEIYFVKDEAGLWRIGSM